MNKRATGSEFEQKAAKALEKKGYHILEMNYHCRIGEIDIVARDGSYLVFVEVKYRKNSKKGMPIEAVNFSKQKNISATAAFYLMSHHYDDSVCVRFDVVSILGDDVEVLKNAFPYCFG